MAVPRLAWVVLSLGLAHASAVTPVQKVTNLLERLAKVTVKEGQDEATAYDKYACFCKEEASRKLYAIENSEALEAKLSAKISKLSSEIAALETEISDLGLEIQRLEGDISSANTARAAAHATFLTKQKNADTAISAVERAIAAMKESKSELTGKVELNADSLAQVRAVAALAVATGAGAELPAQALVQLRSLQGQPGTAYSYKYHSNDIIGTLETVLDIFKKNKAGLEADEFNARSAHELKVQDWSNQKKFAQKDKAEKEEVQGAKTEEKEATDSDRAQEEKERVADQDFMRVLRGECQQKAKFWDQRSQTRQDELTAIGNAVDALKAGVAPNWKANKKLVGLQKKAAITGHWEFVADAATPSFLQRQSLRGSEASTAQGEAVAKAQRVLAQAASNLKSQVLSMAVLKIVSSEDHFVKVRQIIKDLMAKLKADALNEMTEKQFCDEQIQAAVTSRDEEQSKVEELTAQISGKNASIQQLKQEIAELSRQIAENLDALRQKTQLRTAESDENTKTIDDAGKGKEAVEQAISFLQDFYSNHAPVLLQYEPWKAGDSDREGKTVGDLAPEVFDSNYHGQQDASKGIIGILQVILSDFDRTGVTVNSDEQASASAFGTFKVSNEADTQSKQGGVESKDTEVTGLNSDVTSLKDDLKDSEQNHEDALKELSSLRSRCIDGEETHEERVANREKEIEALKEAHTILENWS